ncbi:MAG: hypothetical protein MRERV_32c027 [Mycoplasmataceae bacterium RV_VA103A]|nr:MAG: hypothetical protein MRERV_32c027 [Mycoplasmataceae bacterium RV_VA103A]
MNNRILNDRILERKRDSKIESIDVGQFEYTAERLFTYGTILAFVTLGIGSIAYMTVKQVQK